jgi:hypothetical protein
MTEPRSPSPADAGTRLLGLVEWQVSFGCRYPGTAVHRRFVDALAEKMRPFLTDVHYQDFTINFLNRQALCTNLIGVKKAHLPVRKGPLLVGAHFDTRARADNETDPVLRERPILGANDGGSGVAVLLDLLQFISLHHFSRDLYVVLFDAEDVGSIDGLDFATGAKYLAAHPLPGIPEEVIVLDMVGGRDMVFDVDLHMLEKEKSQCLAKDIFTLAKERNFFPLLQAKKNKYKYIVADHYPFHACGIASFVFIDIDYPEWHTQRDLPEAMSEESLVMMREFLIGFLERERTD